MLRLLGLAFLLLLASSEGDLQQGPEFVVEKGSFEKVLTFSGELQAVDNLRVVVPRVSGWPNMVISYLAPEGASVNPGDILVQFDKSELEIQRLNLEKEREDARIRIAQKESELESQYQDLLLSEASAERALNVAKLYVGIDPQLIPRADTEKYAFDFGKAEIELNKARERLSTFDQTRASEMEVVQLDFERADLRLARRVSEIERMTIRAPMPGLVIYSQNPSRNGKVQVGDSLWVGLPVIELPNLQSLHVETFVYDSDIAYLKGGELAEIVLDAAPDRLFHGRVASLPELAKERMFESQLKAFRVDVQLEGIDLGVMKPGMTARVRVPIVEQDQLVIPREAVRLDSDGRAYVVREGPVSEDVEIGVLDSSEERLAVSGPLQPGERLIGQMGRGRPGRSVETIDWITLERQDLTFSIAGGGTLEAESSVSVGPPSIEQLWRFKIVYLAPEGADVKVGDPLVSFDPTEIQKRLREEEADLKKVEEELAKTKASEELKLKDLELRLEDAKVQQEKAQNRLIQAREFESNLKVMEAQFEAVFSVLQVEILERKLESVRTNVGLQLKILEDRQQLHHLRIKKNEEAVASMTIRAPISGVVIYEADWRNEKSRVGSEVYRMQKVLSLPDLSTLLVRGQIAELDAGKLKKGQAVEATLDAMPGRIFVGTVKEIDTIFRPASMDRPVKMLSFAVELDPEDLMDLRPGMVAKLQVVIDKFEDVLALPLAVIEQQKGTSFVWVKEPEGVGRREIRLGRDNGVIGIIEAGLRVGDQVGQRPSEVME